MGKTKLDLVGKRFGRLTVISECNPRKYQSGTKSRFLCRCDCGALHYAQGSSLVSSSIQSCGCLRNEKATTHGMARSKTYKSWAAMMSRCRNPKDPGWHLYGGRGITVCKSWWIFENFLLDMGERLPGTSIDRIDPNGNYDPNNCRWASSKAQSQNRRNTHFVELNGQKMCVTEWERKLGMKREVMGSRLRRGWTLEKAFSCPVQQRSRCSNRMEVVP